MTKAQLNSRFSQLAEPILAHPEVARMDGYVQHGSVSTLAHVSHVARTSYRWACRLPFRFDEHALVTGALLHDFYLYDWHDRTSSRPHHATRHPLYAVENARAILGVDENVASIIRTHMWPLPISRVPASREALLVCLADKWCALQETLLTCPAVVQARVLFRRLGPLWR